MTTARNKKVKFGSKQLDHELGQLTFGKLLKSHRQGENMSQTELAKALKISRQKLNDFEHGRRFPSLRAAADVAVSLGEHVPTWIAVVLQEMLRRDKIDLKVTIAS